MRVSVAPDPGAPPDADPDLFLLAGCSSGSCVTFGDRALVYPDLPPGTYYLVVDDYMGRTSYNVTVTAYASTGTLLVDADGSDLGGYPDVRSAYTTALSGAGYAADAWDVGASGDPPVSTLLNYKRVIWMTGQYDGANGTRGKVITDAQTTTLQNYLDGGGELLLVSQGYLHEASGDLDIKMDESTFAYGYLQVSAVTNGVAAYMNGLTGANGDPVGDDGKVATPSTSLALSSSSPVIANPAGMDTKFGVEALRTANGKAAVLWHDNGLAGGDYFKVVFASFPMENVTPESDFQEFIARTMVFLDNYGYWPVATGTAFVDGTVADGLPDPGETIGLQFSLQNGDSADHSVQAYIVMNDVYLTPQNDTADLGDIPGKGCSPTGCNVSSVTFNVDIGARCPMGHRVDFIINYWIDGVWCNGPAFGLWVGQPSVFLVKDEQLFPNTSPALIAYEEALTGAGVTFTEWDTAFFGSPNYSDPYYMSNTSMASYRAVVWATGADYASTLLPYYPGPTPPATAPDTPSDERELQAYLQSGGRLFLCSQDYFYDYFGGSSCGANCNVSADRPFPLTDLGILTLSQDVCADADTTVAGQPGEDVCLGMSFAVLNNQRITNFCDEVVAKGTASNPTPRTLFTYPDGNAGAELFEGLVNGGIATARFVHLLFPFENLEEGDFPNSKTLLMKRILYWLAEGDSQSASVAHPKLIILPASGSDAAPQGHLEWYAPTQTCESPAIPTEFGLYYKYNIYRATNPSSPANFTLISSNYQPTNQHNPYWEKDATIPSAGGVFYFQVNPVDIFGREITATPNCGY